MAERVQRLRLTGIPSDAFTGLEGELTIDTSRKEIRLHDAVTPGGNRILPLSATDLIYQARSTELDAISALNSTIGFFVRLGINSWTRRRIEGTTGEITVTNGNGAEGNPIIGLPSEITKNITFTGDLVLEGLVTVDGTLDVNGTFTGNLTGNVTGNLTGNVTGNVMGDLTGDVTGGLDSRGATVVMDNDQIDTAWVDGLDEALADVSRNFVVGHIMLWYGTVGTIPSGWQNCDGTNGTPDLRDVFIVGAGTTYAQGSAGGAATHTHTGDTTSEGGGTATITIDGHALTLAQIPTHSHQVLVNEESTDAASWTSDKFIAQRRTTGASESRYELSHSSSTPNIAKSGNAGSGDTHTHTASASALSAHTHDLNVDAASSLPPYKALHYIMFVGV